MGETGRFVRNPKANRFMGFSEEAFRAVDASALHGLAKGEWYEEVMERYLQQVDKLPSKRNGSIHYAAIERDTGVTYQSIMKNPFLKQGIIDAATAKGTREEAEVVDEVVTVSDDAAAKREIKALKERIVAIQGELATTQRAAKAEHEGKRRLEAHVQELLGVIKELEARLDEVDIVAPALRHATQFIDSELLSSGTVPR